MPPSIPVTQLPGGQPVHRNASTSTEKSSNVTATKKLRKRPRNLNKVDTPDNSSSAIPQEGDASSQPPMTTMDANSPLMTSMLGGGGMYGGMMMGSPYYSSYGYGGMMPGGMMPDQAFSGVNRFLFSVQSVIFSLGQAVQIMGMNTQALRQLLDTAKEMFDHALAAWKEMRALEVAAAASGSEEDKKQRRRLRALRWAMMVGLSYGIFKLIRRVLLPNRKRHDNYALGNGAQLPVLNHASYSSYRQQPGGGHGAGLYCGGGYSTSSYSPSPYGGAGAPYSGNQYGNGYYY